MSLAVRAPLTGVVHPLAVVPDPVFAEEIVGAGLAIEPDAARGEVEVVAPIDGRVVKVHPHAFVVQAEDGTGVLVHLGIDTVGLGPGCFRLQVQETDVLVAGQPVVAFDPDAVRAGGLSAICPVVVLGAPASSIRPAGTSGPIGAGAALFTWTA